MIKICAIPELFGFFEVMRKNIMPIRRKLNADNKVILISEEKKKFKNDIPVKEDS
jgi:hypothetical protein